MEEMTYFFCFLAINNLDPKLLKYVDTKANASPDQNFFEQKLIGTSLFIMFIGGVYVMKFKEATL